jgi:hypothetical protein
MGLSHGIKSESKVKEKRMESSETEKREGEKSERRAKGEVKGE